jgi:hypothetical protein
VSALASPSTFRSALSKIDSTWTRLESALCAAVLMAEILALSLWISFKGLSASGVGENRAGLVFRAVIGAVVLGAFAHRLARRQPEKKRNAATMAAALLGLVLSRAWANVGVEYFSNVLNWLQDSSVLTLLGGLRGVGTELTWLLAMLGGSLATASGKHINVDAVLRFVRPTIRVPVAIFGWLLAATVCLTSVWGFFDHIAIDSFGADADATAGEKIAQAWHGSGRHFFLTRKQLELDVRTLGRVALGRRYDSWLRGQEWNEWVSGGGFGAYYSPTAVDALLLPPEAAGDIHPPLVVVPGGTNRGLLARDLHLIFPFGLLMIGLRFLFRSLLFAAGERETGDAH